MGFGAVPPGCEFKAVIRIPTRIVTAIHVLASPNFQPHNVSHQVFADVPLHRVSFVAEHLQPRLQYSQTQESRSRH